MADRPEIVCLCGSARFVAEMRAANRELTLAGVIVVAPCAAGESVTNEQRATLDASTGKPISFYSESTNNPV